MNRPVPAALLASIFACNCSGGDAERAVTLRFDSTDARARAVTVEVYVTPSCGTLGSTGADPGGVLQSEVIVPGQASTPLGVVSGDSVAVYARARDADCQVYAAGCVDVDLHANASTPIGVDLTALVGPGCAPGNACAAGVCAPMDLDASAVDASDAAESVDTADASTARDVPDAVDAVDAVDAGLVCEAGVACGSVCRDLSSDPLHCGACATACPVPLHGSAVCTAGACGLSCDPGFHACAGACVDDTSTAACGAACTVCPSTPNGSAACTAGACAIVCDPGTLPSGSLCVFPPRPLAPISTSSIAAPRPVFRWTAPAGITADAVKLCRDRACSQVIQTLVPAGQRATPDADLAAGTVFWHVEATAGGVTAPSATWQLYVGPGISPPDRSVGGAPDVDGDGYADVLVGAPGADAALLLHGAPGGTAGSWSALMPATAGSQFGSAVASAGDIDGDGYGDVLIGAPGSNTAYVFRGSAAGVITTPVTLQAPSRGSLFGGAISTAGDVDTDGYADVVVGASGSTQGHAYVYRGGPRGLASTPVTLQDATGPRSQFGAAVTGGGDADSDGYADIAVGAPSSNRVYVYPGSALGTTTTGVMLTTPTGTSRFGASLSIAGDTNGDGYADLVVGAPGSSDAFVFLGSIVGLGNATPISLARPSGVAGYGTAVAMVGDVDGDGYGDLAVGAPDANVVYLYAGGPAGPVGSATVLTAPPGAIRFGASISAAGDVDGDGRADVLIGASGSGTAYLYLGSATGLNPALLPNTGLPSTSQFGASVARAHVTDLRTRCTELTHASDG